MLISDEIMSLELGNKRISTRSVRKSTKEVSAIRRNVTRPKVLARFQRLQWGVGGRGRRGV